MSSNPNNSKHLPDGGSESAATPILVYTKVKYIVLVSILLIASCGGWEQRDCYVKGKECNRGQKGDRGDRGEQGQAGPVGPQGIPGMAGENGKDGGSCYSSLILGGVLIQCSDSTQTILHDGVNAELSPYTVVSSIDPCGKQTTYDEILLRLKNNKILAHYSDGAKQFLSELQPGSYVTTDGTGCYFTVDNDMNIINEHN